jgi:AcrR family transcriptional regulator
VAAPLKQWHRNLGVFIRRHDYADRIAGRSKLRRGLKTLTAVKPTNLLSPFIAGFNDPDELGLLKSRIDPSMMLPQISSPDHATAYFALFHHPANKSTAPRDDKTGKPDRVILLLPVIDSNPELKQLFKTMPTPKPQSPTPTCPTRDQILRAAEKLFAERGFRAMTLRDVTKDARVNLAAVNYHFGSKINLMRAVIEKRFQPINAERLERLDAYVAEHSPEPVPLEKIIGALFRPLFDHAKTNHGPDRVFMQMIGRAVTEPADFMRNMHKEFFSELCLRFNAELKRACPELSDDAIQYRMFLAVSTMIGAIAEQTRLETMTNGKLRSDDLDRICDELIRFVVYGFKQA